MDIMDDFFLNDRFDFVEQFNDMQENDDEHSLFDLDSCCFKRGTSQTIATSESQHKYLYGDQINEINGTGWLQKPIEDWRLEDTSNWLMSAATYLGQPHSSIQQCFAIPGKDLISLTRQDFMFLEPTFGDQLYDLLHSQYSTNTHAQYTPDYPVYEAAFEKEEMTPTGISNVSDAESENSVEVSLNRPLDKPRVSKTKKSSPNQGKLWEFIRDLLRNRKTCPSLICWEDYSQAKFRFVRSDEVAKLWGSRKGNTKMTYEKLSRAMRYYYKRKIFLPVLGRRLVYQFGPNATGWQTDNPNFRQ